MGARSIRPLVVGSTLALGCFSDGGSADGGEASSSTTGTETSTGTTDPTTGTGDATAGPCEPGTLGCPCADLGCQDGLECVDEVCIAACGNGIIDPGEECDDGNEVDVDGCSATCTLETQCLVTHEGGTTETRIRTMSISPIGNLQDVDDITIPGIHMPAASQLERHAATACGSNVFLALFTSDVLASVSVDAAGMVSEQAGSQTVSSIKAVACDPQRRLLMVASRNPDLRIHSFAIGDDGSTTALDSQPLPFTNPVTNQMVLTLNPALPVAYIAGYMASSDVPVDFFAVSYDDSGGLTPEPITQFGGVGSVRSMAVTPSGDRILFSGHRASMMAANDCVGFRQLTADGLSFADMDIAQECGLVWDQRAHLLSVGDVFYATSLAQTVLTGELGPGTLTQLGTLTTLGDDDAQVHLIEPDLLVFATELQVETYRIGQTPDTLAFVDSRALNAAITFQASAIVPCPDAT